MRLLLIIFMCLVWQPVWAALPTILVNSATGSDSAASGAGPGTALTGTAASVAGTATSVSITDAVDLSGVATDGSAVLYYVDGTAGHRNFDNITAISGSSGAWTVTVKNGFTTSTGPFSWAIGGKRASIGSSTSVKLFSNNSLAGDAMPGWTVELQSGHTETISGTLNMRRSGNTSSTGGPIILEGDPAAATMPILTFSNNGIGLEPQGTYQQVANIEFQNSNATKTSSIAIQPSSTGIQIRNVRIKDSTNFFHNGIVPIGANGAVYDSEIANTNAYAISAGASTSTDFRIINCYIHNSSGGLSISSTNGMILVEGNIIVNNTGDGILYANTGGANYSTLFIGNTLDNNSTNGIELNGTSDTNISFINNIFSNNGNYGVKFSSGSISQAYMNAALIVAESNDFYNNTSGKYTPSYFPSNNESTLNPTYTNAAGGDYSIGANLANLGYPLGGTNHVGNYSSTYSYVDIGAAQRQCTGGSGGTVGFTGAQ